jgi:hypothetical protein
VKSHIALVFISFWCGCYALPAEEPRVPENVIRQITPVVYAYIAAHHLPDTIVSFSPASGGAIYVRTHIDNVIVLRKLAGTWRVVQVYAYDVDRDVVR